MASLKKIMNVDDDHVDIPPRLTLKRALEPDPRPPHGPESSFPSRSAFLPNISTTPLATTRSPIALPYPTPSARVGSSPTSGPLGIGSDLSFRRCRNASADSMDSYHGHSYLPDRSSAHSSTMRPGLTTGAPGEAPVKLTPITGRVSKAKKGIPVHECDICQKNFTRAEHLRRHQLSHNPPDLACPVPGCDRVFHREDLLKRHQQRHEQEQKIVTQPPSIRLPPSDPSTAYNPHIYTNMVPLGTSYGTSGANPRPGSGPSAADSSWPARSLTPGCSGMPSQAPNQYSLSSTYGGQPSGQPLMPGYDQPRTMMGSMPSLHTPGASSSSIRWPDTSAPPSSSSSAYSASSDASRMTHFPSRTLAEEWESPISLSNTGTSDAGAFHTTMPFSYDNTLAASMGLPLSGYTDEISLYGSRGFGNSTVRSLSPSHMAVAQTSGTLVTAPTPLSTDRLIEPACQGWRQGFKMTDVTTADGLSSPTLTHATRQAIPTYINVFWEKVAPLYPIVHRTSLEVAVTIPEHRELLACAMAAVATQHLDSPDARANGSQLYDYAWSKAKPFTKSNSWPTPIAQTLLLCEYYARYRGRKKGAHTASTDFARLYQMMYDPNNTFAPLPSEGCVEQRWRVWIDMEARRRILAACFLLDIHSMRYLEQPPTMIRNMDYASQTTLTIPFSTTTSKQWDATKARDWGLLSKDSRPTLTLAHISLKDVSRQNVASVSRFDQAVILAGLSLGLPRRRSLTKIDLLDSPQHTDPSVDRIANLFPEFGSANTYLALQHTPLHSLLSVSGESWVLNNKVSSESCFQDHRQQLQDWRRSGSAAVAVTFAARALRAFLTPCVHFNAMSVEPTVQPHWDDISAYWGFYVCILICWAYGCGSDKEVDSTPFSFTTALKCVNDLSHQQPSQIHGRIGRYHARLVVGLGKRVLMKDCLGGRSILLSGAVNVLKRLDEQDGKAW